MEALALASQACAVSHTFTVVLAALVAAFVSFAVRLSLSSRQAQDKEDPQQPEGFAKSKADEDCAVLQHLQSPSANRQRNMEHLCASPPQSPKNMHTPTADSMKNHPCTPSPPSPERFPRPKQLFACDNEDSQVALIDAQLHQLLSAGALHVPGGADLHSYVQPASIDLPITGTVYLVKEKVLPFRKKVSELLDSLTLEEKSLSGDGAVLLKGQTYLVYCAKVRLPFGSRGCLSPKSSIGRIDLRVRGVVDNSGLYDVVPGEDEEKNLWLEISPRSFNVRLREGIAITQIMVFMDREEAERTLPVGEEEEEEEVGESALCPSEGGSFAGEGEGAGGDGGGGEGDVLSSLDASGISAVEEGERAGSGCGSPLLSPAKAEAEAGELLRGEQRAGGRTPDGSLLDETLCFDAEGRALPLKTHKGAVVLSVCVPRGGEGLAGYEARATEEVVDLSRIGDLDPAVFFRPLPGNDRDSLTLEKDRFYILATKERVCVPVHLSAEMVPFSHHVGELRAHYAGFFDPGFGYGREGELKGTVGVLEVKESCVQVRPHETINIYHGQPICLMEFYRNAAVPLKPYGFAGSNYQGQKGPKLAKYFAPA